MNLNHLAVFREVMKTGSMSEAARNLNRSQPAISLTLKNLESELGFALFSRESRKLKPVPEAHYLFSEADVVLTQMSRLRRTMQRLAAGEQGILVVAAMPGITTLLLPEFLSVFTADKPDIQLSIHTRSSTQLHEMVSSQGVDMGMGDYDANLQAPAHSDVTRISADCRVAIPANHKLATRTTVKLEELAAYPMGALQPEHAFAVRIEHAFLQARINNTVRFRSQTLLPLLQFVAADQCCAIVDPLTVVTARQLGMSIDSVVFRKLSTPIRYDYALSVPKFRPISTLAHKMVEAWQAYLVTLLNDLHAEPKIFNS